jgi:hypothetical protein
MFLSVWTPECDFYVELSLIKVLMAETLDKEKEYIFKKKFNDIFQVL